LALCRRETRGAGCQTKSRKGKKKAKGREGNRGRPNGPTSVKKPRKPDPVSISGFYPLCCDGNRCTLFLYFVKPRGPRGRTPVTGAGGNKGNFARGAACPPPPLPTTLFPALAQGDHDPEFQQTANPVGDGKVRGTSSGGSERM